MRSPRTGRGRQRGEDQRVRTALSWLADPANRGWLLIVDNVDTHAAAQAVDRTLGTLPGGHLLITGRLSEWPADIRARRVDVLDPGAAQDFLLEHSADKRRRADDDTELALALAEELGYLALALEQAAAFIRRRALSFKEYRRRWHQADHKVLQWHDPATMRYQRPLAATWQASVDELPPAARALLNLLAWLAPDPLPRFLFDPAAAPDGTEQLFADRENPRAILGRLCGESDAGSDAGADPEKALAALRDLSLLQPAAQTEFASEGQVHRVLALITRERQDPDERAAALRAALALVDSAAIGDPDDVRTWPVWEPLLPHASVLADHAESAGITDPSAWLLNQLGLLLMSKAQHAEAEPLMRRALVIDEVSLGAEHPDVAHNLNNLGQLLQATNRLAEAEPLMRRGLVIVLKFSRDTAHPHPDLRVFFDNYSGLLAAMDLQEQERERRIGSVGAEAGFSAEGFRRLLDTLSS